MRTAEELSRAFAALVELAPGRRVGLVGIEHEYRVLEGDAPRDFRRIIRRLDLGRPNLDPGDPNAFRMRSGAVITCDGAEAEIALPPTVCAPGFAAEAAGRAAAEGAALARRLAPRYRVEGCSTHISVSAPDSQSHTAAALYARTFAPAMMLLLDRPESPGLLVRPRPGRVELGGEFSDGPRLAAAIAFAVGSVVACLEARSLPPALAIRPARARQRFGWYVDRGAFGPDLYIQGRQTPLPRRGGGWTTAQRQLEASWAAIRGVVDPGQTAYIDGLVSGANPLPGEVRARPPLAHSRPPADNPNAPLLGPIRRPGFSLAPVMLTWETAVLLVAGMERACFVSIPSAAWPGFLQALRRGHLDDVLHRYLALGSDRRTLERRSQARTVGLYDALGSRRMLLPSEPSSDQRPIVARAADWMYSLQHRVTARPGPWSAPVPLPANQ